MRRPSLLIIAGVAWAVIIGLGLVKLYDYEVTPGKADDIATHWPDKSKINRDEKKYQLVMVVHPHCPCTRATLAELELIMTQAEDKLTAHILFSKPKEVSPKWVETDLFRNAQKIPNVHVYIDEDDQEARLFGGHTSGQIFLYDAKGTLLFSGGITATRGHIGDNIGQSTIVAIVHDQKVQLRRTPFFGCLLEDHDSSKITKAGEKQ